MFYPLLKKKEKTGTPLNETPESKHGNRLRFTRIMRNRNFGLSMYTFNRNELVNYLSKIDNQEICWTIRAHALSQKVLDA